MEKFQGFANVFASSTDLEPLWLLFWKHLGLPWLSVHLCPLAPTPLGPLGPRCSDQRRLLTSAFFNSLEFYHWVLGR